MRFGTKKKRQPPAIIIISLIDILMVLLIFLMVTTTFKEQPAVRLALPESKQGKPGASENNVVLTVATEPPYLFLGTAPVTFDQLLPELRARLAKNPQLTLSIRADTNAPFGAIVKVMDIAKASSIKTVSAFIKQPGSQ